MTNEELVVLIQAGVEVNSNMTELYEQNLGLFKKFMFPYLKGLGSSRPASKSKTTTVIEEEDLMQEVYFALNKVVYSFDPNQGFKFMTYAESKIKAVAIRYIQNHGKSKRIPVHVLQQISQYNKFKTKFIQEQHQEPTPADFIKGLGITKAKLKVLEKCIHDCDTMSLQAIVHDSENAEVGDNIADDFNLEESIIEADSIEYATKKLWSAVDSLEEKRRNAIVGIYKDNKTLGQIAQEQGVTTERIRQLEADGIRKLQKMDDMIEIAEMYGYDYNMNSMYEYGCSLAYKSPELFVINRIDNSERVAAANKRYDHLIEQILNY